MTGRTLFYGDSNTWGYRPGGARIPANRRYTTMATRRAPWLRPLADGLSGRTTAWEAWGIDPSLLGGATFASALEENAPLDCCVVMLGTNDVTAPLLLTPAEVAENLRRMLREARRVMGLGLRLVLVSPPPLGEPALEELAALGRKAPELAAPLARVAEEEGCAFFDAAHAVPRMDAEDGIHMKEAGHLRLGVTLGSFLRNHWDD